MRLTISELENKKRRNFLTSLRKNEREDESTYAFKCLVVFYSCVCSFRMIVHPLFSLSRLSSSLFLAVFSASSSFFFHLLLFVFIRHWRGQEWTSARILEIPGTARHLKIDGIHRHRQMHTSTQSGRR